ncbi:MAG: serine hydrolase domain-containing protein [Hyphomonadaceae bacterium]|nr:serine hydrolase domain-containing protein [Hyphomonadaceae bacterium]
MRQATMTRRGALAAAAAAPWLAGCASPRWPPRFSASQALLDRYVAEGKIAGACLAIGRGDAPPTWVNAGVRARGLPEPAGPDTLWRIYSMTKPITAVAALEMIEEGPERLDQPIADFLPAFARMQVATAYDPLQTRPAARPITLRHLMTHTSGLSYHINEGSPLAPVYRAAGVMPVGAQLDVQEGDGAPPTDLETFAACVAPLPLIDDPGARWEYSIGLDVLGAVIQAAWGLPFETFLRRRLLAPLGMDDTGFSVPAAKRSRLAANYLITPDGPREIDAPATSAWIDAQVMPSGGAGLVSSARDYARFCAMLLNGGAVGRWRLLRPRTAALARSNLLPPETRAFPPWWSGDAFGAGMGVITPASAKPGREPPGAYGWAGAAGTSMWIDPVNGFYAVLMTHFMPSRAYPLWDETRAAVYADLAA